MKYAARLVALQRSLYESSNPTRRYLHCVRRDWIHEQISALSEEKPAALAVEIGPGSGVHLPPLAGAAEQVLALDVEHAYLRAASERYAGEQCRDRLYFAEGDLRCAPLRAASVDLLLCSEVLEHVVDTPAMLRGIAELLDAGGHAIVTTPQPFSPVEVLGKIAFLPGVLQLVRLLYREPVEPTGHINVMGRRKLEAQFAAAGLTILRRETLGFYLPVIAEFGGRRGQRLLAWLESLLRGGQLRALLWTQCYVLKKLQAPVVEQGPSPR